MPHDRTPLVPGLSRLEIAGVLGISPRTVEGFEQGRKPIPLWIRKAVFVNWGIELERKETKTERETL